MASGQDRDSGDKRSLATPRSKEPKWYSPIFSGRKKKISDKAQEEIKVQSPQATTHNASVKVNPATGALDMSGFPPEFMEKINQFYKEQKEPKNICIQDPNLDNDDEEVVVRTVSKKAGPNVDKGMSTEEILTKMREYTQEGDPWQVYTLVSQVPGHLLSFLAAGLWSYSALVQCTKFLVAKPLIPFGVTPVQKNSLPQMLYYTKPYLSNSLILRNNLFNFQHF